MPPVRWKHVFCVTAICLVQVIGLTDAQQLQEAISMSSDGWRPIIGTRRQPSYQEEIIQYRNPSQNKNSETIKADAPKTPTSAPIPPPQNPPPKPKDKLNSNNVNPHTFKKHGSKLQHPNSYFGTHGPHIPLGGAVSHLRQNGPMKKYPMMTKQHSHVSLNSNGKRILKPLRVPSGAHSTRDEVYVPAPNTGSYAFISQGPNNIKTREAQGLGLLGGNHFTFNHPTSSVGTRFALQTNDNIYQQYNPLQQQSFLFTKPPQSNDVHYSFKNQNDEYTRNLVPPPPYNTFQEQEKTRNPLQFKDNVQAVTEPITDVKEHSDNVLPFDPFAPSDVKNKVPPVEVQVTKEKFKVFHNHIPSNYNPQVPDFVDYDYHTVRNPVVELPKTQTYEVTEGKWLENQPPVFNYRPREPQLPQRTRKPSQSRQPVVELNLPPFLPTPYKPEGVVPTSPTQSEVSTIFSQVTTKMNKYKDDFFGSHHPLFFDIKEVSTHYPILGRPVVKPAEKPDYLKPLREKGEISNEITTNKIRYSQVQTDPQEQEETTTLRATTREPQRTRPTNRRRRPVTRVRPTTTEIQEVPSTERYEIQKSEEIEEETQRPQRRRPSNRYRTSTQPQPPSSEESSERTTRGKQRYRQRGSTNSISQYRRRLRPTDLPSNHKITKADMESTEYTTETQFVRQNSEESTERETQGLFETKFTTPQSQSNEYEESIETKPNKFEYKVPSRRYKPQRYQEETESPYETTAITDSHTVQKLNNEEATETTERVEIERTQFQSVSTTEPSSTTNIHIPENEVDFSTFNPISHFSTQESGDDINQEIATLATTTPTTSTTEASTTKSHRIRGRPIKYDTSHRPSFSVKEYRQRLNQHSTTTSPTTESYRTTSESLRVRFPNRSRSRQTTTTAASIKEDDGNEGATEPVVYRSRYKAKGTRNNVITTETPNESIITEKNVRYVNTRLRPFGRYKTTTDNPATTSKVSIKPNLFSQRRRPPQLSLRSRIHNKLRNNTEEKTTALVENETDTPEPVHTTLSYDKNLPSDIDTELEEGASETEVTSEGRQETTTPDILRNESILYSQRVSDLTSSSQNEYNTPGVFKSVSPTSRRIPNYFTISTDDPILPIEAFFPNIKDKEQQ